MAFPQQRRTHASRPGIDGLSGRAVAEVARLEHTRNYLEPGDVILALDRWKQYVRGPERRLWDECEWGNVHWYCCGNPLEGRALLDRVLLAMTPRSARELRAVLIKYDALWITPYPGLVAGGAITAHAVSEISPSLTTGTPIR